jgi:phosphoglycerol transferase MdoB-like AlkP superfamily enzyme
VLVFFICIIHAVFQEAIAMAVVARLFEQSRFSGILLFLLINLGGSALLRTALLIRQLEDLDVSFYSIALAFLLGIINDLAFFSYLLIPFALYLLVLPNAAYQSKLNRTLIFAGFFVGLYGFFFVEVAEWTFWDEFGVRFNFIAVDYLIYTHEVVRNIIESYPLGGILSGIFIMTAACFLAMRKLLAKSFKASEPFVSRLKITAALLSLPLISYVGVGQSAHQFSANTYLNELAANGPYQFFAAFRNNELDYRHFYKLGDDRQLSGIIRAKLAANAFSSDKELYNIRRTIKHAGEEKHLNVILITVESLSAEFLTHFGNTEHITPFMDEWFEQGLLFTNFYATGTRTVRGLEALTLSIPPTPGQSIIKRPDNGNLFNLGHVFQQRGYDTAFLYGGRGYFDNMNAFFSGNGYRIIDQTDFTDEEATFANAWGVSDDIILKRNHRPYTYPEGKIDIPSGTGRTGGVKYTDYALREFIGLAKTRPWFDDTLFVVVADHCAGSARKVDLPVDRYHIPLFIYAPKHVPSKRNDILSSQIDVAPTILGLLNFSYESQFYGRDLMRLPKDEGRALISNYQKLGLVKNNKLVYLSPRQRIDVIEDPLGAHRSVEIGSAARLIEEEMAYYQSADYIWSHRLNRHQ